MYVTWVCLSRRTHVPCSKLWLLFHSVLSGRDRGKTEGNTKLCCVPCHTCHLGRGLCSVPLLHELSPIQRPCYQRGSPCQDPAGNRTTRRPPDDRKETQTAVVWSCFPFIRSGQNHLARHSERGKKTRQTEEEVGRHH